MTVIDVNYLFLMVFDKGLEPSNISILDPKSNAFSKFRQSNMAGVTGLEPITRGFEVRSSTN